MKAIIYLLIIFLISCSVDKESNNFILEKQNGYWYDEQTKQIFTGLYVDSLSNGKIRVIGFIKNGEKDSVWTYYYFNSDNKKSEGQYVKGIKHGEWKEWYSNGNLKSQMYYNYGIPIGEWYEMNEVGRRQLSYCKFENGNGFWGKYYENGLEKEIGYFKDGKKDGKWEWFYDDGKRKWVGIYNKGVRVGEWVFWSDDESLELRFSSAEIDSFFKTPLTNKKYIDYFDISIAPIHFKDVGYFDEDRVIANHVLNR